MQRHHQNTYVMVDFHIDVKAYSGYRKRLVNIMNSFGLTQEIKEFTRITESLRTIVDILFTDEPSIEAVIHRAPKWSDHDLINFESGGASQDNNRDDEVPTQFGGSAERIEKAEEQSSACKLSHFYRTLSMKKPQ
ncbi:hypothetical protein HHI36_010012 [Cryptolaemus montrouzieri]|uniref:Uncharacterized protein n=1 Tax=Cryptolaemus montrouzieri TaxID=559131 RepID=A0ABD2MHK0_9CUCU